ncbi:NAD(P)/FAD-dependent oxidoreductase [Rubritalea tangerina]|uniref:NAD(P)/FAD-dependent oxidoreductase n=1 Tax=Rubritalea tangerina TaxID=430798 RepID=A0ABW4ZEU9_9BACT
MNDPYDFLIVGQGLAGSALAMALLRRGKSVVVIDRQDTSGASRVAAGLVTTLAGKGMNPAWRQERYLPEALEYYRALERKHGTQLFYPLPVLRLFTDEREQQKFARKIGQVDRWVGGSEPDIDKNVLWADAGGFEMAGGGRLDTVEYLEVVRKEIEAAGRYIEADFDASSLVVGEGVVEWEGIQAGSAILCQGYVGLAEGPFAWIDHRSAKGEMLSVKVEPLDASRILNRNGWMVPIGEGVWRAGATYGWDDLSVDATDEGRAEVESKVRSLIKCPYTVCGHEVGIRPIIQRSQPVVGLSPESPQLGFFNGLGSKGVITAPSVGEHFAGFLCGEWELDVALSIERLR